MKKELIQMSKSVMNAEMILDLPEIGKAEDHTAERPLLLGYYDYTVILTYLGMLSAFMGILMSVNGNFKAALICLMFTGFCDMFDGAVAATKTRTKSEKRFGIQIDSLSDLISFGVLPGVFVYMFAGKTVFSGMIAAVYTLFALIRLSYFNVREEERQEQSDARRSEYLGVPVTTVALVLPILYLLFSAGIIKNTALLPAMLMLLGICFITTVKVKKPHTVGKIMMILLGIAEAAGVFFL